MDQNSPGLLSINFLTKFIEDLDESSPFYYPLILIDSGIYTYNNKNIYGYGLISNDILKYHLNNIIPEIIITFSDRNNLKYGDTNKLLGSVTINLPKTFPDSDTINISRNINDKNILIDLSLRLFFTLFHEYPGKVA